MQEQSEPAIRFQLSPEPMSRLADFVVHNERVDQRVERQALLLLILVETFLIVLLAG